MREARGRDPCPGRAEKDASDCGLDLDVIPSPAVRAAEVDARPAEGGRVALLVAAHEKVPVRMLRVGVVDHGCFDVRATIEAGSRCPPRCVLVAHVHRPALPVCAPRQFAPLQEGAQHAHDWVRAGAVHQSEEQQGPCAGEDAPCEHARSARNVGRHRLGVGEIRVVARSKHLLQDRSEAEDCIWHAGKVVPLRSEEPLRCWKGVAARDAHFVAEEGGGVDHGFVAAYLKCAHLAAVDGRRKCVGRLHFLGRQSKLGGRLPLSAQEAVPQVGEDLLADDSELSRQAGEKGTVVPPDSVARVRTEHAGGGVHVRYQWQIVDEVRMLRA